MQDRSCGGGWDHGDPLAYLSGRRVFVRSFGCALNQADSLRLEARIRQQGGQITGEGEAEVLLVNTCTVVSRTEREVLRYLRCNADKEIYVTGCMAALQPEAISSVCHAISLPYSILEASSIPLGVRINEILGRIPIARGCCGDCSYCIARKARGDLRSESIASIRGAVQDLSSAGVREIQLTAQDVSAWGRDQGQNLPHLLEEVLSLPGRFRLRLGMMNPSTLMPILEDLLPLYSRERMYAFTHIPVQSGSDSVLKHMNRGYRASDFLELIRRMREQIPEMWIATDVIVGFPGETDRDFRDTLDLIRTLRPNKVNITRFSPRPGTLAENLPDILDRTKKERSRSLSRLADQICRENNQSWIDRQVPVVAVERIREGSVVCRTPEYRSVVLAGNLRLGSELLVRINGAKIHYLTGIPISQSL